MRLGHRGGNAKDGDGENENEAEADQTKLVLTSARAGAPKRGASARALI